MGQVPLALIYITRDGSFQALRALRARAAFQLPDAAPPRQPFSPCSREVLAILCRLFDMAMAARPSSAILPARLLTRRYAGASTPPIFRHARWRGTIRPASSLKPTGSLPLKNALFSRSPYQLGK